MTGNAPCKSEDRATRWGVPRLSAAEPCDCPEVYACGLPASQKRWFTLGLAGAKKPETRARRIEKYVGLLAEGRAR